MEKNTKIFDSRKELSQPILELVTTAERALEDAYACLLYTSPSPRDRG